MLRQSWQTLRSASLPPGELSAEDQAKLTALREMVTKSIERGGSLTDEEVETSIAARLDAWEHARKGS